MGKNKWYYNLWGKGYCRLQLVADLVERITAAMSDRGLDPEKCAVFHCVIHQERLCSKVFKFNQIFDPVISCIDFIKPRALNHRQLQDFFEDLESD